METFFYVVGGALVLLALGDLGASACAATTSRPQAMLRIGVLVVVLVVGATAYARRPALRGGAGAPPRRGERGGGRGRRGDRKPPRKQGEVGDAGPAEQGEGPADPAEGTDQGGDTPAGAAGRRGGRAASSSTRAAAAATGSPTLGPDAVGDDRPEPRRGAGRRGCRLHRDLDRRPGRGGRGGLRRRDHARPTYGTEIAAPTTWTRSSPTSTRSPAPRSRSAKATDAARAAPFAATLEPR